MKSENNWLQKCQPLASQLHFLQKSTVLVSTICTVVNRELTLSYSVSYTCNQQIKQFIHSNKGQVVNIAVAL